MPMLYMYVAICVPHYIVNATLIFGQSHSCTAANDVTRQKDLSKFHRHLLNRLDRGTAEEEPGPAQPTESQRRVSREKDGSSYQGREKERKRRSESDDRDRQRERRRSGEETERRRSRHRSGGSVSEEERKTTAPKTVDNEGDREKVQQPEQEETERGEDGEEEKLEEHEVQNIEEEEEALAPKLPSELTQEDKEERRKAAAIKRTDSQAQLSAKERYLARKRARTSAPIVAKDD